MIYAVRKKNESSDKLMNRFKKQVQHSRILMEVRNGRYYKKKPNKQYTRDAAVMREQYRTERRRKMYYDYTFNGNKK